LAGVSRPSQHTGLEAPHNIKDLFANNATSHRVNDRWGVMHRLSGKRWLGLAFVMSVRSNA
jgi:hypothetical protein